MKKTQKKQPRSSGGDRKRRVAQQQDTPRAGVRQRDARARSAKPQNTGRQDARPPEANPQEQRKPAPARFEIKGILFTAIGIVMLIAFYRENAMGYFGTYIRAFMFGMFGLPAYFVPSAIIIAGISPPRHAEAAISPLLWRDRRS
jgi:hypothetical protein